MIQIYPPHVKYAIDQQRLPGEVTLKEAEYLLGCNQQRIRGWIKRGYLQCRYLRGINKAAKLAMVLLVKVERVRIEKDALLATDRLARLRSTHTTLADIDEGTRPEYADAYEASMQQRRANRLRGRVMSDTDPAAERAERQRRAALALTPVEQYRREWRAMQRRAS
jgi:hypothetical protein